MLQYVLKTNKLFDYNLKILIKQSKQIIINSILFLN